ncbi:unnamed protein product, partial [Prorocentrum cordatum]
GAEKRGRGRRWRRKQKGGADFCWDRRPASSSTQHPRPDDGRRTNCASTTGARAENVVLTRIQ